MNAHYRLKTLSTLLIVLLLTVSCAVNQAYKRGTRAEIARDYETAMENYRVALAADPGNLEYRLKFEQARFTAALEHFQKGRRALAQGDADTARAEFLRAVTIDPSHEFARQELLEAERVLASRAQRRPEPILDFEQLKASTQTDPNPGNLLKTNLTERISSINMSTQIRTVYENLAALAGLTVIFESAFRNAPVIVDLKDVNIFEALDLVSLQARKFWQPLNATTIFVMEDTQTNRRDFEDHFLKTIYLTNTTTTADLNAILNVLRTTLTLRSLFQMESQNAIVIHDTLGKIAMAEQVIRSLDKPKAEVIIDVVIMEIDRSTLRDLGIRPPETTALTFNGTGGVAGAPSNNVRLSDLDGVDSGSFSLAIPDTLAKFVASNLNARVFQNPRIRTTDQMPAQLRIGSNIPIPTTSIQNNNFGGGASTAYTYRNVGVSLDITTRVLPNRDVYMTIAAVLDAPAGDRQVGELLIPVLTSRQVGHTIRLKEGETNVLGGIISDTETLSMTGVPGLKDIPLLKYLFGQEHKTRDQAEVIIMLTPHIIRMPEITEEDLRGVNVGGESNLRLRPTYTTPEPATTPATTPARPAALPPGVTLGPTPTPPAPVPPAPAAPTTAVVTFAPTPITLAAQGQTAINLAINGPDIAATELTLTFDPGAFTIQKFGDGGFLSRDGQIIALVQNVDNQRGTARVTLERSPGAPVVAGNGTLVTVTVQPGSKKGPSTLRVTDFGVRDARGTLHPGRPVEVQVTVP